MNGADFKEELEIFTNSFFMKKIRYSALTIRRIVKFLFISPDFDIVC